MCILWSIKCIEKENYVWDKVLQIDHIELNAGGVLHKNIGKVWNQYYKKATEKTMQQFHINK